MPGYVIHVAVAQEYIKKHKKQESKKEFIEGSILPDLTTDKSKTHYGKSPAYTNLKNFLENNEIETSLNRGKFLHLITDYLFYNYYLDKFSKKYIYDDYDILNKLLIDKYQVTLPEKVVDKVFFKEGKTKILNIELACKIIDEVSKMDLDEIKNEVLSNTEKWNYYKNII